MQHNNNAAFECRNPRTRGSGNISNSTKAMRKQYARTHSATLRAERERDGGALKKMYTFAQSRNDFRGYISLVVLATYIGPDWAGFVSPSPSRSLCRHQRRHQFSDAHSRTQSAVRQTMVSAAAAAAAAVRKLLQSHITQTRPLRSSSSPLQKMRNISCTHLTVCVCVCVCAPAAAASATRGPP